jgi:hypothetical protein
MFMSSSVLINYVQVMGIIYSTVNFFKCTLLFLKLTCLRSIRNLTPKLKIIDYRCSSIEFPSDPV